MPTGVAGNTSRLPQTLAAPALLVRARWFVAATGPSSRRHVRSEDFPKLRSVVLAQINLVVLAFEVKSHRFVSFTAVDVVDEPDLGHACHAALPSMKLLSEGMLPSVHAGSEMST